MNIHPTALVSKKSKIHPSVKIGPFSIVDDDVIIEENTTLQARVTIHSHVTIGKNNNLASNTTIGGLPQDINFDTTQITYTSIGNNNIIRENFTVNRSAKENGTTKIGSHCFFMCNAHVGHDCKIEDHCIIAPGVNIGGHAVIGNRVFLSGSVQIHQFARVGQLAMVGGVVPVIKDILPFSITSGNPAKILKVNVVGLKRAGYNMEQIETIAKSFRFYKKNLSLDHFELDTPETQFLKQWLNDQSHRGITRFISKKK